MAVPASLFIQPFVQRTAGVSLPAIKVLDAQTKYAVVDSIFVTNANSFPIFVTIYVSNGNFILIPNVQVPANSFFKVVEEAYFGLPTGQTLFASSDSSQNLFNISVEGRVFLEVA